MDINSDPFSRYPEQTAIVFDNKDEVLKSSFWSRKLNLISFIVEKRLSVHFRLNKGLMRGLRAVPRTLDRWMPIIYNDEFGELAQLVRATES